MEKRNNTAGITIESILKDGRATTESRDISDLKLCYLVIPSEITPRGLPDYVVSTTKENIVNGHNPRIIIAVSAIIPYSLRPYYALYEHLRGQHLIADEQKEAWEIEREVLELMPTYDREPYRERKITHYKNLVKHYQENQNPQLPNIQAAIKQSELAANFLINPDRKYPQVSEESERSLLIIEHLLTTEKDTSWKENVPRIVKGIYGQDVYKTVEETRDLEPEFKQRLRKTIITDFCMNWAETDPDALAIARELIARYHFKP